jgi:hypothetical protein
VVGRPAKKPAHDVPKALRNYGKLKIPVLLMGGEDCSLPFIGWCLVVYVWVESRPTAVRVRVLHAK